MAEPATLAVHRCRFVDFTPSAITSLAFPPAPLPPVRTSAKGKKKAASIGDARARFGMLAVGRANGNIELLEWTGAEGELQSPQAWTVRKTLAGPHPSKVDSLAFAIRFPGTLDSTALPTLSDLRLFSAGGGSELIEWDLDRSCVRRTINSQGGSIWSFAVNPASTQLALGCEDGAVRLLSLEHDTLAHARRLDRAKTRLLSVAWGPPVPRAAGAGSGAAGSDEEEDDEWEDEWIVAGGSDSALRKWDVKSGRVVERMGTDKVRGERTLVWAVGVLGDGTIVSGDSLGMVKFWDAQTCTQLHSFQGHGADVLCLAIGPEGTAVYTSGVDQKVTQFTLVQPTTTTSSSLLRPSTRWIQSTSRRLHSHDVRALASWPPYAPLPRSHAGTGAAYGFPADVAPVLASGGLDAALVLAPAALARATIRALVNPLATSAAGAFEDAYHRRVAYARADGGSGMVRVARAARVLMCVRDAGVGLWRILPRHGDAVVGEEEDGEEDGPRTGDQWEKLLEMELSVQTNLIAGAISDDARWLAISDAYETKLFAVQHDASGGLKPRRVKDFAATLQAALPSSALADAGTGASSLVFTPDASKLVVALSSSAHVLVVDLGDASAHRPRVLRRFEQHRLLAGLARVVRGRTADADAVEGVGDQDPPASSDEEDEDPVKVIPTITRMAVSPDGQWLVTTDDRCHTHVFNLDSIQHHCVLPSLPQPAHALAFDPARPSTLVLGLANNTLQVFDVEARRFPDWARALAAGLPKRFTHLHDALLGVTFDPSAADAASAGKPTPHAALFWGATWMCKVVLDAPAGWGGFSKKRRRAQSRPVAPAPLEHGGADERANANFKMITHYRPILFVDFVAPGELVVVERPLVDVLSNLPPAYWKPKYGAS